MNKGIKFLLVTSLMLSSRLSVLSNEQADNTGTIPVHYLQNRQIRETNSQGAIGFYGSAIDENLPDPEPPKGPEQKPPISDGSSLLPDTGFKMQYMYGLGLGLFWLFIVLLLFIKRHKDLQEQ